MTWPCSWEECPAEAKHAMTFRGQLGHVHECDHHTAFLREWADVESVVPLPCPHMHGPKWVDIPRALPDDQPDLMPSDIPLPS